MIETSLLAARKSHSLNKPRREPIAKVDAAWLRMESPTNLMMITGVIVLEPGVDLTRLTTVIQDRFLAFPRFRYKAVNRGGRSYWEEDQHFEITAHVRRTALPGKADKAELEELVSQLASTPLDHSKPLWQFHLVENYAEGPVLIPRIHHCYADGMALVQVLLSLTEKDAEGSLRPVAPEQWTRKRVAESNVFRRLLEPARDGLGAARQCGHQLVEEALALVRDSEIATRYLNEGTEMLSELGHALTLSRDPPSRFKGALGVRKQVAWTEPLDLEEVRAVGKALGATVNDVLISSMAGALYRYLDTCGDRPDGLEIRATVPVNLRPLEHSRELGNHFGLVFLDLPVCEAHPLTRLRRVAENMAHLKNSKQAKVSLGLLAVLGVAPSSVQKPALEMLSSKASTVLTNVPGPKEPLYLAGSRIQELMFWVPQTGNIGMGISILSYNGKVFCGMVTDHKLVPDTHNAISQFRPEFENLLHLTMMLGPDWIHDDHAVARQVHDWIARDD